MQNWLQLPDQDKVQIYNEIAARTGMTPHAVEKDWWVTATIRLLFSSSLASHLVFKGGTSLSKAWDLIERFSEDIDLAVDRKFLGFTGPMTPGQVRKLRRRSFDYISKQFYPELIEIFALHSMGVEFHLRESGDSDQDPLIIEIYYPAVLPYPEYIAPRVLVEIGSRSLREPFSNRGFSSLLGKFFPEQPFADAPFAVPSVNPERTLLEKIFLLHEEFQKPSQHIRVERLSRHLYDVEKLIADYGEAVLADQTLYKEIVAHRKLMNPVKGIDYGRHKPEFIDCIPPDSVRAQWKKDYGIMQEQMIYGPSHAFEELIALIITFRAKINSLDWTLE